MYAREASSAPTTNARHKISANAAMAQADLGVRVSLGDLASNALSSRQQSQYHPSTTNLHALDKAAAREAERKERERAERKERERAERKAREKEKEKSSNKPILPTAPDVIVDGYGVEYDTGEVLGQVCHSLSCSRWTAC